MDKVYRAPIMDATIRRCQKHARLAPGDSIDTLVNKTLDVLEEKTVEGTDMSLGAPAVSLPFHLKEVGHI